MGDSAKGGEFFTELIGENPRASIFHTGQVKVTITDSRARPQWTSVPIPENSPFWEKPVYAFSIADDQERVRKAFGQCIVEGKICQYITSVFNPDDEAEEPGTYKVTLFPTPRLSGVGVGCCVVCTRIPLNKAEYDQQDLTLLRLAADDHSVREIAAMMHRSESAVDTRIRNLKTKLGQNTLPGLVARAITDHLI